jgi:predicted DNA-binding protein (MmcQ/YjbR family)
MSFSALARFAMTLPGATQHIKWGADWVASVGGKMFLVGGPHAGSWTHCSFKVDDHRFLELTGVPGVVPAPYAARYHWVAVTDAKALPLSELQALVKRSHELVAAKLPRKLRLGLGIEA